MTGARQGLVRVVGWPPWFLDQGQWPPWISSMFWYFLWSNISRKQTRPYRKSTKEATSGKDTSRSALPILPSTPYLPANVAYRIGIRSVDGDPETWFSVYFQKIVVKIRLPPGLCPGPRWGAYSAPQTHSWKRLVLTTMLKNRSRATAKWVIHFQYDYWIQ